MISDPSWRDRTSAWWVKADRAQDHPRASRSPRAERFDQPFRIHEEAILLGVQLTDTYEEEYRAL